MTENVEVPDAWPLWLSQPRRTALSWLLGVALVVWEVVTGGDRLYVFSAGLLLMGLPITTAFDRRLRQ